MELKNKKGLKGEEEDEELPQEGPFKCVVSDNTLWMALLLAL